MIEEVKDIYDDVEKAVGKKGMWILGGVAAIGAIYLVSRSFKKAEGVVYYEPTTVGNYPSVEENADLVLDSVNDLVDLIDSYGGTIGSRLDYLEDVIASTEENVIESVDKNTENVIQNVQNSASQVIQNSNSNKQDIQSSIKDVQDVVDHIDNEENQTVSVIYSSSPAKDTSSTTGTVVPETYKSTAPATYTEPVTETYTYTTKSGLNTSTSIVDALKAAGVDSSYESRKAIAEANGISNYTGTAAQNTQLLNSMKAGTLVKSSGSSSSSSSSSSSTKSSSSSSSSSTKSSTYSYTSSSGLNTSGSIVDALKAAGADSSYASRKAIAEANGISNYTGTAAQNTALLNSMKAGTLKKA